MSFMVEEENKKVRRTAQTKPDVTDLQTQPDVTDLQTQPDVTDLTDWDNTQVGTYTKKGTHPKDLEKE